MTAHPALPTALAPLAAILPLALIAALCLPAPSLALPAFSALAALSERRGVSAGPVPRASRGRAPVGVLTHPP